MNPALYLVIHRRYETWGQIEVRVFTIWMYIMYNIEHVGVDNLGQLV